VVITQRPALLNSMDKLLVLRAGRMEAFGPPKDVLRRLVGAAAPSQNGKAAPAEPPRADEDEEDGLGPDLSPNGKKRHRRRASVAA
jgi:hypothetical protein